jgi:hypothetical protein
MSRVGLERAGLVMVELSLMACSTEVYPGRR